MFLLLPLERKDIVLDLPGGPLSYKMVARSVLLFFRRLDSRGFPRTAPPGERGDNVDRWATSDSRKPQGTGRKHVRWEIGWGFWEKISFVGGSETLV